MAKRDPQRTMKLRIAVRYLLDHDCFEKGNQSRLAEYFRVSRQRVHQIVVEERKRSLAAQATVALATNGAAVRAVTANAATAAAGSTPS